MAISVRQWDDRTSWNRFVSSVPDTHFQLSREWGQIVPRLGSRAVRPAATRGEALVGAVQVFIFGLWQLYFSCRFAMTQWDRRRRGLPVRQFA